MQNNIPPAKLFQRSVKHHSTTQTKNRHYPSLSSPVIHAPHSHTGIVWCIVCKVFAKRTETFSKLFKQKCWNASQSDLPLPHLPIPILMVRPKPKPLYSDPNLFVKMSHRIFAFFRRELHGSRRIRRRRRR